MAPRALSARALAFARAPWRRRRLARGDLQEVRRELGVGADHPDQPRAIFGATTLGVKSPQQGRGVFEAQMNLSEIVEQFKASKHDGLHHRKGIQDSGVRIRGSDLTEPWREVKHACRKETIKWGAFHTQLQHGIVPERVGIITVRIAGSELIDPLGKEVPQRMVDIRRVTLVTHGSSQAFCRADLPVDPPK
jgi:hypothetical protein